MTESKNKKTQSKSKNKPTFQVDTEALLNLFYWPDKSRNGMLSYRYYDKNLTFQKIICLRKYNDQYFINWTETQMKGFKTEDIYQIEIKKGKLVSKTSTFVSEKKYQQLLKDIKKSLEEMNVEPVFYKTNLDQTKKN